ncbi:MAG: radical SAM protein [Bacteroidota bacterium]
MKHKAMEVIRHREYQADSCPTFGPESVGIVPTHACNLNCITCWSYSPLLATKPSKAWKTKQLPFPILQNLLPELATLGTRRIILTGGGDPLVYPHFNETVMLAKKLGLKVTLISNLTLIQDLPTFLQLEIDTIQANFSAADPASYVAFHPNRKSKDFTHLLETLSAIAQTSTELKLVCVICRVNAHLIPAMLHLAKELGAGIQFKLMSIAEGTAKVSIDEPQRQKLHEQAVSLQQLALELGVKTNLSAFFQTLRGENVHSFPIDEIGCFAGLWYSRIWADGTVHYCCNPTETLHVGSLHEQSFTEIWRGEAYQTLRVQLRSGHFVAGCQQCGKFDLNWRLAAVKV